MRVLAHDWPLIWRILVIWCGLALFLSLPVARFIAGPKPPAGGGAAIPRAAAETATPQAAVPPAGPHPAHPHDLPPPDAGAPAPPDWIIYGWKCRCRQTITLCGQVIDQRICADHDNWAKWEAEL